ncbi:MAG: ABC transporter ATP-binding protein [Roseburia sp.]
MIEISHLVKKYGDHVAVDDLSLTVEQGKIYGFLGPNGAGKSTTMNIITGYLGATSGEVKINGFDIFTHPEEAKKCVGYLPELPPLYMDMTVKEYLDFVAELKQLEKSLRSKYVEEAMEITRTKDVAGRMIRNLSKGYRQRVGFAQAVLGYPETIILDEPTVGLDPKQIIEIRDLIRELGKKHTIILSSHILSEISAVCDHVFIISKGRLVASDSTENLLGRMTGAQELELLVKADRNLVKSRFLSVPGVESCECPQPETDEENAGNTLVHVTAKKDADVREELFTVCAENHMPILEMRPASKSLEDVFLELTAGEEKKGGTKA